MPDDAAQQILLEAATRNTERLRQALDAHPHIPRNLRSALEYVLLSGGKRLRPTLVLETFSACGGSAKRQPSADAAAAALEMIHTFSLVHDDLPAMDDDDLRRGQPTCHIVYGEALAILTGDALVTLAFQTLARDADGAIAPRLIIELAAAAGPAGMIGGQVLDIAGEHQKLDLPQLQEIHRLKTGALLVAACRLGAIAADASAEMLASVTAFAQHIGLAFQIVDDLLDVTGSSAELGKATKKDHDRGKNTYPALLGVEASKAAAAEQLSLALESLSPLGPAADRLRTLARFVVQRLA